jgi:alpha-acetolactate decarboxylase
MEGVSKLVTLDGELILFEGRYEIRSQEKVIVIYYNSTASVGIQENTLVCFMQES